MLESLLSVGNICWSGDAYQAAIEPGSIGAGDGARLHGRFACASAASDGSVTLVRDRLGLNKLFVAVHESGSVVAANYLVDMVHHGVPFEAVYSVPAGHVVRIAPKENLVETSRYGAAADDPVAAAAVDDVARDIRLELEEWFSRMAAQFGDRHVCVCLSGGLDSGLIAALARKYFKKLTAYTYSFAGRGYR